MEQLRPQGVIATHQRLATRSVSCVPSGRRERSELAVCVNCPHVSALFPCLVPAFLAKSPTGAPQYTPVFAGVPRRPAFALAGVLLRVVGWKCLRGLFRRFGI